MTRALLAVVLLCVAVTATSKTKLLEHLPLVWRPTSDLRLGTVQMSGSPVMVAPFTDGRDNKQAIGENREDETPKRVTTTDDVGLFVGIHVRGLLDQAGIKTVDANGAVTLRGEVTKFFVREESTYKSEVQIQFVIVDANGVNLWKGLATGEATRFGRSYRADNYYEVLADALVNAMSSFLQAPEIQKALAGQGAAG
jgi:hypothetical protein